jgi:hypothetical protein
VNRLSQGGSVQKGRPLLGGIKAMDPVYSYFRENLGKVTKQELLEALKNALESAASWRDACLLVPFNSNLKQSSSRSQGDRN